MGGRIESRVSLDCVIGDIQGLGLEGTGNDSFGPELLVYLGFRVNIRVPQIDLTMAVVISYFFVLSEKGLSFLLLKRVSKGLASPS